MYCVYLTTYSGNKLPPFYIGYTKTENIERGYRGSASSKEYKHTWKEELAINPHLFKIKIIKEFSSRKDAFNLERKLLKKLNAASNPMYINKANSPLGATDGKKIIHQADQMLFIPADQPIPDGWFKGKPRSVVEKSAKNGKGVKKKFSVSGMERKSKAKSGDNSSSKRPEVRKKISESLKGRSIADRCGEEVAATLAKKQSIRMKEYNPFKGKTHSEDTKNLLREVNKGMVISRNLLTQEIIRVTKLEFESNPNLVAIGKNKIWANNGIEVKSFFGDEVLPEGWVKGSLLKRMKFYDPVNKITKWFHSEEDVPLGWIRGAPKKS